MIIHECRLPGVLTCSNLVYGDDRGYFAEIFRENEHQGKRVGSIDAHFVQENESYSFQRVLRGLHFQKEHPQAKLVRVVEGCIFDVVVDLRPERSTFGHWLGFELRSPLYIFGSVVSICSSLFIPAGCAHGFLTLSKYAIVQYRCTDYYHQDDQAGIRWNDPDLKITWDNYCPSKDVIVSKQDDTWPQWSNVREELLNARQSLAEP